MGLTNDERKEVAEIVEMAVKNFKNEIIDEVTKEIKKIHVHIGNIDKEIGNLRERLLEDEEQYL